MKSIFRTYTIIILNIVIDLMFSNDTVNIYEADGYQYWPAWMFYNLQHTNQGAFNHLPLNIVSLDDPTLRK